MVARAARSPQTLEPKFQTRPKPRLDLSKSDPQSMHLEVRNVFEANEELQIIHHSIVRVMVFQVVVVPNMHSSYIQNHNY
jgi:hypothetical protein